jgi:hypothetical protein
MRRCGILCLDNGKDIGNDRIRHHRILLQLRLVFKKTFEYYAAIDRRKVMAKTTERALGQAVMRVLAERPSGEATVRILIRRVPAFVRLTAQDRERSDTRPLEEMWEQRVRNLKSHDTTAGNVIGEGFVEHIGRGHYRLTAAGRLHLEHHGLI